MQTKILFFLFIFSFNTFGSTVDDIIDKLTYTKKNSPAQDNAEVLAWIKDPASDINSTLSKASNWGDKGDTILVHLVHYLYSVNDGHKLMEALLEREDIEVNKKVGRNKRTALHFAAINKNELLVNKLALLGGNSFQLDSQGRSPFDYANYQSRESMIWALENIDGETWARLRKTPSGRLLSALREERKKFQDIMRRLTGQAKLPEQIRLDAVIWTINHTDLNFLIAKDLPPILTQFGVKWDGPSRVKVDPSRKRSHVNTELLIRHLVRRRIADLRSDPLLSICLR